MPLPALATLAVLLIGLNQSGWQSDVLGTALGIFYLAVTGYLVGGRLAPKAGNVAQRIAWGVIATLATIGVLGTAMFYLHSFTGLAGLVLLAVLPWFGRTAPDQPEHKTLTATRAHKRRQGVVVATYLALVASTWYLVSTGATVEAIRTPWESVPPLAVLCYGLTAASALAVSFYLRNPLWLAPFYLLSLGLLPLVYPLGFGFDPFIHQASEKLLTLSGTITPKPLYYLGQYTIVTTLSQVLHLPIAVVDTWVLPLLASLSLPLGLELLTSAWRLEKPWRNWLLLLPLAFALSSFTYTTPQGLSNLWALLTLILLAARLSGANVPRLLLWLLAGATAATHPLTGLPTLGVLALAWAVFEIPAGTPWRTKAILGAAATTALIVPASFLIFGWLKPGPASLKLNYDMLGSLRGLGEAIASHLPFLPQFVNLPDVVYLWGRPLTLTFLLLAASGYYSARRDVPKLQLFGYAGALLAAGYLVLKLAAQFPGLPAYEQDFYTVRLWDLALMSLWPLALIGGYQVMRWLWQKLSIPLSFVVAGALVLTASFYLTYPRVDTWHRDTAYNTTPADAEAVQLIDHVAGSTPYVVLANQAVAAAAIREFGFTHYYAGNFYYPVPTGTNPLYQVYSAATETGTPTRATVARAAELGGVNQVYLVLNRYWADFLTLTPVAIKEANQRWVVADDRVEVFRYDF